MAKRKKTTGPQEISIASLPVTNPDNIRPVYTNHAGVQVSNWDIRILFAEIVPKGDSAEIQLRAQVVMTPAHAKALAIVLAQHVAVYERENGQIPWPPKAAGKSEAALKSRNLQLP